MTVSKIGVGHQALSNPWLSLFNQIKILKGDI